MVVVVDAHLGLWYVLSSRAPFIVLRLAFIHLICRNTIYLTYQKHIYILLFSIQPASSYWLARWQQNVHHNSTTANQSIPLSRLA